MGIGRNIQSIVCVTLIGVGLLFLILPFLPPTFDGKQFDDNDQVGSNLDITNTTGKGFYNEGEAINIVIGSDKVGKTLRLRIAVLSLTENLTLYFLTSTNYITWNTTPTLKVENLSQYSFGSAPITNGSKVYVEAIPSIITYSNIPINLYIVITNSSDISGGTYEINDVDVTRYSTYMNQYDFIYGIIMFVIAAGVIIVPFYVKRKLDQRKIRKTKPPEPRPQDLTLQEVIHEEIKPESVREVDFDPNKKLCARCGSKVDISVQTCTTCGNKF